jgi:hypothetical protein
MGEFLQRRRNFNYPLKYIYIINDFKILILHSIIQKTATDAGFSIYVKWQDASKRFTEAFFLPTMLPRRANPKGKPLR